MKEIFLIVIVVLLVFYMTNPIEAEFESFLMNQVDEDMTKENLEKSKNKEIIDNAIVIAIKEEIKRSYHRENFYLFSIYKVDSLIMEGGYIGIFRFFIPLEKEYKSINDYLEKEKTSNEPVVFSEYELGEMYSNVKNEGRIAKFNIVINYTGGEEVRSKIKANEIEIINNVYKIFRAQTFEKLSKADGKLKLGSEIQQMIIYTIKSDIETLIDIRFKILVLQS